MWTRNAAPLPGRFGVGAPHPAIVHPQSHMAPYRECRSRDSVQWKIYALSEISILGTYSTDTVASIRSPEERRGVDHVYLKVNA